MTDDAFIAYNIYLALLRAAHLLTCSKKDPGYPLYANVLDIATFAREDFESRHNPPKWALTIRYDGTVDSLVR